MMVVIWLGGCGFDSCVNLSEAVIFDDVGCRQ